MFLKSRTPLVFIMELQIHLISIYFDSDLMSPAGSISERSEEKLQLDSFARVPINFIFWIAPASSVRLKVILFKSNISSYIKQKANNFHSSNSRTTFPKLPERA